MQAIYLSQLAKSQDNIRLTAIPYTARRDYIPSLSAWIKKGTFVKQKFLLGVDLGV